VNVAKKLEALLRVATDTVRSCVTDISGLEVLPATLAGRIYEQRLIEATLAQVLLQEPGDLLIQDDVTRQPEPRVDLILIPYLEEGLDELMHVELLLFGKDGQESDEPIHDSPPLSLRSL